MGKKLLVLLVFGVFLTSCAVGRKAKEFYRQYIYPKTTVNLKEKPEINVCVDRFASYLTETDGRLENLLEDLNVQETLPGDMWAESMFKKYPWLTAIEVVSHSGENIFQYPKGVDIKQLKFSQLWSKAGNLGQINFQVCSSPLGPEFVLYKKIWTSKANLLLIVHFDVNLFFKRTECTKSIEIFVSNRCIWPKSNRLKGVNWDALLQERTYGRLDKDGKMWWWLGRKIGDKWLIYAYLCS
ncbi:MAG: hypothetical protein Q9M37_04925 [Desulfonauticus sp.]|nr:hypothetical protein [Desulfonauticus sp.]